VLFAAKVRSGLVTKYNSNSDFPRALCFEAFISKAQAGQKLNGPQSPKFIPLKFHLNFTLGYDGWLFHSRDQLWINLSLHHEAQRNTTAQAKLGMANQG